MIYTDGPAPNSPPRRPPAAKTTAAVVLGYVGLVVGICAPIGLVLALVARSQAHRGVISPRRTTHALAVTIVSTSIVVLWAGLLLAGLAVAPTTEPTPDFTVTVPS